MASMHWHWSIAGVCRAEVIFPPPELPPQPKQKWEAKLNQAKDVRLIYDLGFLVQAASEIMPLFVLTKDAGGSRWSSWPAG